MNFIELVDNLNEKTNETVNQVGYLVDPNRRKISIVTTNDTKPLLEFDCKGNFNIHDISWASKDFQFTIMDFIINEDKEKWFKDTEFDDSDEEKQFNQKMLKTGETIIGLTNEIRELVLKIEKQSDTKYAKDFETIQTLCRRVNGEFSYIEACKGIGC